MGVRLRQMCNCVICFRPRQSNAESASMPRLETLVTCPDASNRLSHVTWVFRITLRSSVSKHLRFGISTPCRNVSFASAIPTSWIITFFGLYIHRWTLLPWDFNTLGFLRTVLGYDSHGQSTFNSLSYSRFIVLF